MRQKLTMLASALALVAGLATTAQAQEQPRETTAELRNDADRDRDMDLGWIGLLGLAGLMGLRRRDHVDSRPVVRTDSTIRTDAGYPPAPGR